MSKRLSVASSHTSSVDLHRSSSSSSHDSTSTNASSIASNGKEHSRHRKTFSGGSIHVPRRFLKKPRPQEKQRPIEPAPTSAPLRPPRPPPPPPPPPPPAVPAKPNVTPPLNPAAPSKPAADWQCSDLVVRCKNDVYHVDRVIMCYHSRWFARVCAVLIVPVSRLLLFYSTRLTDNRRVRKVSLILVRTTRMLWLQ